MADLTAAQLEKQVDRMTAELSGTIRGATAALPEGTAAAIADRRKRAQASRLWFFTHYLPHLFAEPMGKHHDALSRALDAHPLLVVLAFRGWGKSTFVSYAEAVRGLLIGGVEFAVMTSRTEEKTYPFVLQIRLELEHNARLIQDFGPFVRGPVWQADHFALAGGTEVRGLPIGGSSRGLRSLRNKRPQLWVLDDLQELKDAKNPERIEETMDFIGSVVIPAMDARRSVVRIVGTKMSEDCALARLEANPHYPHFRLDAAAGEDGVSLPAEEARFPSKHLARIKALLGSDAYAREYLNTAIGKQGLVRRAWIKTYRPEELAGQSFAWAVYWDPALGRVTDGDYKAIVTLLQQTNTGRLFVRAAFVRKDASPEEQARELIRQYLDAVDSHGPGGAIGYESNGFQSMMEYPLASAARSLGLPALPLQAVEHTQNKDLRVAALVPLIERGDLFFREDEGDQTLLVDQFVFWPKRGKDGPDAVEGAYQLLLAQSTGREPVIMQREDELHAWPDLGIG